MKKKPYRPPAVSSVNYEGSYDESCHRLAEGFLADEQRYLEAPRFKLEAHVLAQVIQDAVEDHLKQRQAADWTGLGEVLKATFRGRFKR